MKKIVILILLSSSILFFANCHQKAFPIASDKGKTDTKTEVTQTSTTTATATTTTSPMFTADQIAQGKTVFEGTCNKCHDLPKPSEHNVTDWNRILPEMFHKAGLAEDKRTMVNAYVQSNARQW